MKITLRQNGNYDSDYTDNTDLSEVNLKDGSVVVVPDSIFHTLKQKYKDAGHDVEMGLNGLPSPLTVLTGDDLIAVKKSTARYNRQTQEKVGVTWGEYRFKTDTNTCQSLSTAIQGMQTGMIASGTVPWRDADGKFGDFTVTQLQEIAVVVMAATEENFAVERSEIEN